MLNNPMPPYDPARHNGSPPLQVPSPQRYLPQWGMQPRYNPQQLQAMMQMRAQYGVRFPSFAGGPGGMGVPGMSSSYAYAQNRIKTEDMERQVKDDVFKALEAGIELDQTDPGELHNRCR